MSNRITSDDYPFNLLNAVSGSENGWEQPVPSDIVGTIEYVLCTFNNERERYIIKKRYQEQTTLAEIADDLCLTRECVRQTEIKTLAKLNTGVRKEYLTYGISGILERERSKGLESDTAKKLDAAVDNITQIAQSLKIIIPEKNVINFLRSEIRFMSVDDLELSVRTYNCLRRSGIDMLHQLVSMNINDVRNIRNLGRKSFNEIKEKIEALGLNFYG